MTNKIEQIFYELIRVAIGKQNCLSHTPTAEEWKLLYDMAKKVFRVASSRGRL